MSYKPTVLLDVDDVIAKYTEFYIHLATEVTGVHFDTEDVTEWDIVAALKLKPQTDLEIRALMDERSLHIPSCPKAVTAVRHLQEIANVVFVTAPLNYGDWVHKRLKWLQNHFQEVIYYPVKDKSFVAGDVFVDDRAENLLNWHDKNYLRYDGRGTAILWDTPFNKNAPTESKNGQPLIRTNDWDQVIKIVKEVR